MFNANSRSSCSVVLHDSKTRRNQSNDVVFLRRCNAAFQRCNHTNSLPFFHHRRWPRSSKRATTSFVHHSLHSTRESARSKFPTCCCCIRSMGKFPTFPLLPHEIVIRHMLPFVLPFQFQACFQSVSTVHGQSIIPFSPPTPCWLGDSLISESSSPPASSLCNGRCLSVPVPSEETRKGNAMVLYRWMRHAIPCAWWYA